ncbi:MAG TPA: KH domain-containing protein [Candidatus Dormibacteraeota bacterium]|jgi:hypothetical protein|nr:KH domain-containing protein [Candidatus Dormibacteraeota bacterium]
MTADYRDLVEYLVKNIVDKPDAVVVESHTRHRAESVEIRLDPGDVGRVIGKGGRNIEAIRSLVKAAATKDHRRVNVEVISERDGVEGESEDGTLATAEVDGDGDGDEETAEVHTATAPAGTEEGQEE